MKFCLIPCIIETGNRHFECGKIIFEYEDFRDIKDYKNFQVFSNSK